MHINSLTWALSILFLFSCEGLKLENKKCKLLAGSSCQSFKRMLFWECSTRPSYFSLPLIPLPVEHCYSASSAGKTIHDPRIEQPDSKDSRVLIVRLLLLAHRRSFRKNSCWRWQWATRGGILSFNILSFDLRNKYSSHGGRSRNAG